MSRLTGEGVWQSFHIVHIADHPQKVLIRRKTALYRGAGMKDNRPCKLRSNIKKKLLKLHIITK